MLVCRCGMLIRRTVDCLMLTTRRCRVLKVRQLWNDFIVRDESTVRMTPRPFPPLNYSGYYEKVKWCESVQRRPSVMASVMLCDLVKGIACLSKGISTKGLSPYLASIHTASRDCIPVVTSQEWATSKRQVVIAAKVTARHTRQKKARQQITYVLSNLLNRTLRNCSAINHFKLWNVYYCSEVNVLYSE